ncbi:MAG: hypothetical protein V1928_01030 [Parcubacteria group bacterium]
MKSPEMGPGSPKNEPRQRFDELFEQVAGIKPDEAETNEEGMLFIPPKTREANPKIRKELTDLAGPNGWKNHLVNDEYAGYWIRRPE